MVALTQPEGASAPQLAGRESGKRSGAAEQARDFFFPLCFLVHEERGLRAPLKELQRRARAAAINTDPRDGHGTLRLLLQPQEACVQAQVTLHTSPPGSLCSPPWPGSRDPGTTSPGECMAPQAGATSCRPLPPQARPASSIPLPPPGLSEPEPPRQLLL